MSISETGHFPPEKSGAAKAFEEVNILHNDVRGTISEIQRLSLEKKRRIGTNYLSACVGYFANHEDDYLRRVGTTIFDAISSGRVTVKTNKSRELKNRKLQFTIESSNKEVTLLMPLKFIVLARKQPIAALAGIVYAFSWVVDVLNRDEPLDVALAEKRAEATQAHFLKSVGVHEITSDPDWARILSKYPKGIFSLTPSVL